MTIKEFENKYGVKFTLKHTGKMQDMISLSTSVSCNENCKRNAKIENSICSHCYASRMMKRYKTLENKLAKNTGVLTSAVIPVNEMPKLNVSVFRFESFGDLNNETQVINYFNLCKANQETTFALWTKSPWIINKAIESGNEKPNNLVIIVSSLFINKTAKVKYSFIDKVFTVYDKETASGKDSSFINCGARNCNECRRCYRKTDSIEYINELLK